MLLFNFMKKTIRSISVLCGFALIFFGVAAYFNSPPKMMAEEVFAIEKGDNLHKVAGRLVERKLIKNERFFVALARVNRRDQIRVGNYRIYANSSSWDIIDRVFSGPPIINRVTIPEGSNIYDIASILDRSNICSQDDFLKYCRDRDVLTKLGLSVESCEGYLFPDTYNFSQQADPRDVISVMNKRMNDVLLELKVTEPKFSGKDINNILTLASLVEEESAVDIERPYIASVFYNRLKKKMRLDSDPTVRYAARNFSGPILRSELDKKHPYNTYRVYGLPPGPIASAGRKSIEGVLRPYKTEYLFFVSRNNRTHYFSKNNAEHNRAVEFYQRGKNNGFIDRQKLK